MIVNHSTAAVGGLTVSDVNFNISTTDFVFCKSGVLLFLHHQDTVSHSNFGLQDALLYQVLKKCATLGHQTCLCATLDIILLQQEMQFNDTK